MAYNTSNKEELFGEIQTATHNKIKVVRISDKDGNIQAVDIRQWFNTEEDAEYKATQKGVRIKYEQLSEFMKYIIDAVGADVLCDLSANYNIEVETENES